MHFHDHSCDLGSNHLLEYEENAMYIWSNVWCTDVASEKKSNFPYFLYMKAQGELHFDPCNSLNEVEYHIFVFPVEEFHGSDNSGQFQFDVKCYDHAESYFHSEQSVDSMFDSYMHYEDEDSSFVLPNELIVNNDVLGKTRKNENFSLPQENVNENKVYDRGKKF